MDHKTLRSASASVAPWAIEVRRDLHRIPELRWKETQTLSRIDVAVREMYFQRSGVKDFVPHSGKGGVWYDVVVDETSASYILFRADIDALQVIEATDLPFASVNGCMHGCGHDVHPAMLLGAMKAIAEGLVTPTHNLRFVFQRAEENPISKSGGHTLVEDDGVLVDVSDAHALHVWPEEGFPAGTFGYRAGAMLANSDRFHVTLTCTGGHVAYPNQGSNATDIIADVIVGMRGFGERFFEPGEQHSCVPAMVRAGENSNTRPGTGEIWFSARNFRDEGGRTAFETAIRTRITAIVSAYPDATVTVNYVRGHPSLHNDPQDVSHVHDLLTEAGIETKEVSPISGGEDFAHYLRGVPGSMWLLGAWQEGCGPIHSPTFNPDENAIQYGILFWLLLATS